MTEPQVVAGAPEVSEREAQVLGLLAEHHTNAEIAARLFISVRTVESHVSSLLRKLGSDDRRALARLAGTRRSVPSEPAGHAQSGRPPLPVPLTSFVGRATERDELASALAQHRLVTALGPGGVGKTRLALAVAADLDSHHPDGAWYVDLVPVDDSARIGEAVAAAVGFGEQVGQSPTETVLARFADADALVVLDNCEHIVEGVAALVERLLSACPGVVVLATSQARLRMPFESVFLVPGLSIDADDATETGDALDLFLERAAMAGWSPSSPNDVRRAAAVCAAMDGSALAIELAAARLANLGLDGLEIGLGNPLEMLAGGARVDQRHRSVRSAIDWSYGLLDEVDQVMLRQASVFAGRFTAAAAAEVLHLESLDVAKAADSLARLADQSLLVVSVQGATGWRMLETIRQYCREQLDDAGEHGDLRARHLAWCLKTASAMALDAGSPDYEAFATLADELRAAFAWASRQSARSDDGYSLARELGRLTFVHGLPSEAQHNYELAASFAPNDEAAADALHLAAMAAATRLMGDEAVRLFRAASDASRRAGDASRAAIELTRATEFLNRFVGLLTRLPPSEEAEQMLAEARALPDLSPLAEAAILVTSGHHPDPVHLERASELAQQLDDPRLVSVTLDELTVLQVTRGEVTAARDTAVRRVELLTPHASDIDLAFELSDALKMAPMACVGAGDLVSARRYGRQRLGLPFYRAEPHLMVSWLLIAQAMAGEWDEAVELADQFRIGWVRAGRPSLAGFWATPSAVAMVHGLRGDNDARAEWLTIATELTRTISAHQERKGSSPWLPLDRGGDALFNALVALHQGKLDLALTELADEPKSFDSWPSGVWRQWYAAAWTEAAVLAEHRDRSERLALARPIAEGNPIATALLDRAEALMSGDRAGVLAAADALSGAACRYQHARSLVLAGGDERPEGEALLSSMGAAPMAV